MKPLYELVTAAELKVGDVVRCLINTGDVLVTEETLDGYTRFGKCERLRRLPATEDPRVLRRALEIACTDKQEIDEQFSDFCIDLARKELETEPHHGRIISFKAQTCKVAREDELPRSRGS